ncbi:uncharacterized protein LOC112905317 [Agrilus planipennis]|uniref:Uncharacterized protein LOC112905317 n=1 Tax=Agrilus planipennis TaxID=224129 RepID=A0A7F5RBC1_AGRPL|nr:uncharacterized protein LOC112905317 [Agrilus planipennis]XP_025833258.1 uncharacterized protein LOC112905317 [Agrilus planipennis]
MSSLLHIFMLRYFSIIFIIFTAFTGTDHRRSPTSPSFSCLASDSGFTIIDHGRPFTSPSFSCFATDSDFTFTDHRRHRTGPCFRCPATISASFSEHDCIFCSGNIQVT